MNYVTVKTYFNDMSIVDNRLKAIEHILDTITKKEVEELSEKKKGVIMEPTEYFDNYPTINEKSAEDIRKECYKDFMTNLEIVYGVVSALPNDIQLDVLINMMKDI